jgi:hypothetical protein
MKSERHQPGASAMLRIIDLISTLQRACTRHEPAPYSSYQAGVNNRICIDHQHCLPRPCHRYGKSAFQRVPLASLSGVVQHQHSRSRRLCLFRRRICAVVRNYKYLYACFSGGEQASDTAPDQSLLIVSRNQNGERWKFRTSFLVSCTRFWGKRRYSQYKEFHEQRQRSHYQNEPDEKKQLGYKHRSHLWITRRL